MILFQEDWNKYPTAIADYNTNNKSFVRYALLLKEMGIKNYQFCLALINPALQNVDPFSENLTIEQMAAISLECKLNFWYFLREIARAPAIVGNENMQVRANRGNIALFWLFFNHITVLLIQIRQTGKSFNTDVLMDYLLNIRCLNTQINLITKDEKLRTANIRRLKSIDECFPFYLRQRTKADANNTETITVKKLNNIYQTHLPQTSPRAAENVGRGLTSPILHADEAAYLYNIKISLSVALGSLGAAIDMAKRNNEPYGVILTTTVGDKDSRDGKYIYNILINSAVMTEKFYDCKNLTELEQVVRSNSPSGELRVNCTYNHRQLGYTDQWLKETIERVMGSPEAIRKDYFNEWGNGNATHPLPLELLGKIRGSLISDYYTDIGKGGYITRWYIEENEIDSYMNNNQCVLACDPSDAGGGDDISILILNISNGKVIAAGNYNETNLIKFSEWIYQWFVRFPNLVGIIERRSSGASIIDYLIMKMVANEIDPFKKLFNRVVNDRDEFPDRFKEINYSLNRRNPDTYTKYKKYFGFATSGGGITSRTDLYSITLMGASRVIGGYVHDKLLIDQIAGLTTKSGRVDHEHGEHDDLVIAWLLSYWFLSNGKYLDYYDINSRHILTQVKANEYINETPINQYQMQEQQYIREEIESLYDLMVNERDEQILRNYEAKINFLSKKLILEDNETFSVDEFMRSIQEERKIKFISKKDKFNSFSNQPKGLTQNYIREDLFNMSDPYYRRYY